ncbi:response regulator [Granulosicoccus antarcticus]|uniref:Response regulatory domain-containing protein n=1 Tax=Granulosicoccus antarcticus IMCC3135 TaxID=1192854 RepID=A0A2Z2NTF1_9GAMM|nr:response regulator [Granulosicoccus antarcticus]ASJ70394.1 hypothetical protein IMCC3135_01375 [Granulosicoccus antarcticus IMCC3135]
MNSPARAAVGNLVNELVLVDDDKLTVEIVSWIVKKSSYQSTLFTNADEALAYLRINTPKLLVVDFYMPQITGLEFITELHACSDLSRTSVYLCSAVSPSFEDSKLLASMNVQTLEKQLICDRKQLGVLLEEKLEIIPAKII